MSPEGALTWATDRRWKTGIVPYVHADGARVPALRRLYRKYPYFTNGTAADAVFPRHRDSPIGLF